MMKLRPVLKFPTQVECRYFMQRFCAMVSVCVLGLALLPRNAEAQSNINRVGATSIISSADGAPTFEIAIPQTLNADASVRLAGPAAHNAKGLEYPLWLSDANIQIKRRAGQRQAIAIQALRGNPTRESDLLFEFDNSGQRYLVPYTVLLDNISTYSGQAMPAEPLSSAGSAVTAYSQAIGPRQVNTPTPNVSANLPSGRASYQATSTAQRPRSYKTPAPAVVVAPTIAAPNPAASSAASATLEVASIAPPASSASSAPPASQPLSTAITPPNLATQPEQTTSKNLLPKNWLTWALGLGVLLVLAYILIRLWQAQKTKNARNAPILTQETQFHKDNKGAVNTVFGLTDQEAVAMQQQWVQQQMGQKT